jgi:hypothetical protein
MGLSDTMSELGAVIEDLCWEILEAKKSCQHHRRGQHYEEEMVNYSENAVDEMAKAVLTYARKMIAVRRFLDNPKCPEMFFEPEGLTFDPRSSAYALDMEWIKGKLETKAPSDWPKAKEAKL